MKTIRRIYGKICIIAFGLFACTADSLFDSVFSAICAIIAASGVIIFRKEIIG